MLKLVYNPYTGYATRDGDLPEKVRELSEMTMSEEEYTFVFATDNLLNAMRVEFRQKRLPLDRFSLWYHRTDPLPRHPEFGDIQLFPDGFVQLRLYPSGGISPWPHGFCDRTEFYLMDLL